jgi:hypothetical protein
MHSSLSRLTDDTYVLSLTDDELISETRSRWNILTESLVNISKVVGEMHRRGLDLSYIPGTVVDVLRKIDSGQIAPELADRFMQLPVFKRLKNLPVEDQRAIAETGTVAIVVRHSDKFDVRQMPIEALDINQQRLVFKNGRIRSQAEMIAVLEARPEDVEDPYNESIVCFKFPSVSIDLKKSESKALKEKAERVGGMTELLKHAIKRML